MGSYHHSEAVNIVTGEDLFKSKYAKNIDWTLSKVEESKVTENTSNGYTFKSITIRETYP